ncbi:exported hypothetical protein [Xanthomonas citri pv. fuscans]|nr:exported hypothetical protein [Xanthomonas citri pv. fuscans]
MKNHILLLGAVLASGCASENYKPSTPVSRVQTTSLCAAYGMRAPDGDKIRAELSSRNAINAEEWVHVERREITVGMRECAVQAIVSVAGAAKYVSHKIGGKLVSRDVYYRCHDVGSSQCPLLKISYDKEGVVTSVGSAPDVP